MASSSSKSFPMDSMELMSKLSKLSHRSRIEVNKGMACSGIFPVVFASNDSCGTASCRRAASGPSAVRETIACDSFSHAYPRGLSFILCSVFVLKA